MSAEDNLDYLPYFTQGTVVKGFGRGSSELGIPTANFPDDVICHLPVAFACGVYHGWACVNTLSPPTVYKMVMCVGWNPHYHNTVKTMETHIMHKFGSDFYGENLRIIIVGFIRPMCAFDSKEALIDAMNQDISYAEASLEQPKNLEFSQNPFLTAPLTQSSRHSSINAGVDDLISVNGVHNDRMNGQHGNGDVQTIREGATTNIQQSCMSASCDEKYPDENTKSCYSDHNGVHNTTGVSDHCPKFPHLTDTLVPSMSSSSCSQSPNDLSIFTNSSRHFEKSTVNGQDLKLLKESTLGQNCHNFANGAMKENGDKHQTPSSSTMNGDSCGYVSAHTNEFLAH